MPPDLLSFTTELKELLLESVNLDLKYAQKSTKGQSFTYSWSPGMPCHPGFMDAGRIPCNTASLVLKPLSGDLFFCVPLGSRTHSVRIWRAQKPHLTSQGQRISKCSPNAAKAARASYGDLEPATKGSLPRRLLGPVRPYRSGQAPLGSRL